ncbi:hypothetical protein LG634_00315 [Streptomyces bambusae]|uniref:hypothetical protein n=1 Tax=Streptomyces bambusae TaxID=1550616 RepID=UPI001CFC69C0|nr:hypothetical protein [Streptomyces bambusae]MCB5163300.1 hypothetical protein [Streptomyces bambusae]
MKKILGFLSFVLTAGGISGLLGEWLDFDFRLFGFLHHISPDGYEVYTYLVLTVVGIALALANDARTRTPTP